MRISRSDIERLNHPSIVLGYAIVNELMMRWLISLPCLADSFRFFRAPFLFYLNIELSLCLLHTAMAHIFYDHTLTFQKASLGLAEGFTVVVYRMCFGRS